MLVHTRVKWDPHRARYARWRCGRRCLTAPPFVCLLANVRSAASALFPLDEHAAVLAIEAQREAQTIFAAAGVDLADLEEEKASVQPLLQSVRIAGVPLTGNSTAQSLRSGTLSGRDSCINGEGTLQGRLIGIKTPVNRTLQLQTEKGQRESTSLRKASASQKSHRSLKRDCAHASLSGPSPAERARSSTSTPS